MYKSEGKNICYFIQGVFSLLSRGIEWATYMLSGVPYIWVSK